MILANSLYNYFKQELDSYYPGMGRPPRHLEDDFIDAARELFASGGTRRVTMSATAAAAGAPSGSIYHRFDGRSALLAALWLRTSQRFATDFAAGLGTPPDLDQVVARCAWVVEWCRKNLPDAIVLQAGAKAFEPETWSAETQALWSDRAPEFDPAELVNALVEQTGHQRERVAFVVFDMPLAVVRRSLSAGKRPRASDVELTRQIARELLRR